jgi:hypothetical protein
MTQYIASLGEHDISRLWEVKTDRAVESRVPSLSSGGSSGGAGAAGGGGAGGSG